MANIQNRSPWFVTSPKAEPIKFRSLKQAEDFLADHDIPNAKIRQGQTAYEAQIRLIDAHQEPSGSFSKNRAVMRGG